ncbi:conserved hypothetical protein [Cupriavidus taiwanensis]|uniref:Uncharacterized protein n=1 Tax=Cupriavidus taiwanensis TaxID=164546 RepID=A0A375EG71_9BURK|nr:conserved hypothetical protein [Cupriavidus taiwanensis]SOZ74126.1 conserved hypothetical protein [Cupriavidus taiwanensis]SOZ75444.1 conserved hypothetical protein [Cupriavidus taiwanensis]SPA12967.1 conserved hypothetical protein [Cupriavidus taiwanensis]
MLRQFIHQRIIPALHQVVLVLHTDNRRNLPRLRYLRRCHVAQPDVADQPLPLQLGQRSDLSFDRAFRRRMDIPHEPQVDDIQHLHPQIAQVVMDRLPDGLRLKRRQSRGVFAAAGAYLGDDHQVIRVRMEGFADELVGDVRAVEITRIDVVHAGRDGFAQHGDGCGTILRRSEHAGPGQLHGAVAHAVHGAAGKRVGGGGTVRLGPLLADEQL